MQSVENAKGRKYGVHRTEWVTPLFPVIVNGLNPGVSVVRIV